MKKSTRKWWKEGAGHIEGKQIIRGVAKKYGCGVVEEERFSIDLHDFEPELYPESHVKPYQADLFITRKRGKALYRVIAEVDGLYHEEHKKEDALRDARILKQYGIAVVRFQKEKLLKGKYSEAEIAEKLGLI